MKELRDFIRVYDDGLDPQVCQDLITFFENHPNKVPGTVWNNELQRRAVDLSVKKALQVRLEDGSSEDRMFAQVVGDNLQRFAAEMEYYPKVAGVTDTGYDMKRYDANDGFYAWHCDHFLITMIFYLNDVEEGGETEFVFDYKVAPKEGRVLIFPSSFVYPHRGIMPVSGPKYTVTTFIY